MSIQKSTEFTADLAFTSEVTNPSEAFRFSRPVEGSFWKDDWEYNFSILERSLVIRDDGSDRTDYTPYSGRLFLSTDTGEIAIGTGTAWRVMEATGDRPAFVSASVATAPTDGTDVARLSEVEGKADDPHGNEAHTETYVTEIEAGNYTSAAVAETITQPWSFDAGLTASTASVSTAPSAATDVARLAEVDAKADDPHGNEAHSEDYITAADVPSGEGGGMTATKQTAAYSAAAGDIVLANASSGGFSVTLPAADAGMQVAVKKIDTSANAVTITTPGAETIDGQPQLTITGGNVARTIASDGLNYFVI